MSQTLSRGLEVLVALGREPRTIGSVAEQLGVHHSTALRLLHTLEAESFVIRRDGRYMLGPRVAWLGQMVLEQIDLRTMARPHISALSDEVGETVHLATLMDSDVVYVDKVESSHPVRMYSQVGKTAPLHCTGVAKAIAANNPSVARMMELLPQPYERFTSHTRITFAEVEKDLAEGRERGFVLDDREHEDSIHCIATAIYSADGSAASAISVTVPVHRCDREQLLSYAPQLMATAAAISAELGHLSPSEVDS
jgi:DNA-binding IclR family transcriptional regulator